jgi:hypothetical protein
MKMMHMTVKKRENADLKERVDEVREQDKVEVEDY